jgi:phosphatidylinositol 4-kinase type 2
LYRYTEGITIPVNPTRHSWNASAAWKPAGVATNSWVSTNSLGMNSAAMSAEGSVGMTSSETSSSGSGASDSPRCSPPGGDLDLYGREIHNGNANKHVMSMNGREMNNFSSPTTQYGSPDLARSFDLARQGLAMGNRPQLASGGTGGAYFLRGSDGETCAVFKPADEEPCARNNPRGRNVSGPGGEGLRKGTRVGEGASREVAAYVLDHAGFAGVPATSLANLCEMRRSPSGKDLGGGKLGSLQAYVRADAEAEEMGPALFPVHEVHKITQLDVRLANTDRNAGNILVQKGDEGLKLVPIDHGYALPPTLEDVCFEWEFWPQAKLPYSEETREYIATIDVEADVQLIREHGIELQPSSERVLRVCTTLLQKAAALGCCPADIAGMMSRPMPNRMSDLEKLTSRAASQAAAAVRAQDGLVVHLSAAGGKGDGNNGAWDDLDNNDRMETRFMVEYEKLLESYLEGFEPEMELEH